MKIVKHFEGKIYLFSNKNLKKGDKVFPLTSGRIVDGKFYVDKIETEDYMTGWPDDPHTILDLHHNDIFRKIGFEKNIAYQIRTDKGCATAKKYFKLVKIKEN